MSSTEKDIFYIKSLENINNEISNDQIAFSKDTNVLGNIVTIGDRTVIRQNNMIIEMLVAINKQLETLKSIIIKQTPTNNKGLTESIDNITKQLGNLTIGSSTLKTPRMGKTMLVWEKF